jgi:hypothetical protein
VYYSFPQGNLRYPVPSNAYGGCVDMNVRAFRVVQAATSEQTEQITDPKKMAARKGGLAGGVSRAKSISAERRREIARIASKARWKKNERKTTTE